MANFYVYILSSQNRTLYIGVTNDLQRRLYEHKTQIYVGFSARYQVHQLVYFEETTDVVSAIAREKQLKGWRREKKIALIERANPLLEDLSDQLHEQRSLGD